MDAIEQRVESLEEEARLTRAALFGNGGSGIRQDMAVVRTEIGELNKKFDDFKKDAMDQIKAMWKRTDGRPSWAVLMIITTLSSTVVALLVVVVRR